MVEPTYIRQFFPEFGRFGEVREPSQLGGTLYIYEV